MKSLLTLMLILSSTALYAHSEHVHAHQHEASHENEKVQQVISLLKQAREQADQTMYEKAEKVIADHQLQTKVPAYYLAEIAQYFHRFDAALAYLDKAKPGTGVAVMRANILLTQGKVKQANQACKTIDTRKDNTVSMICLAKVASLQGELPRSYKMMEYIIRHKKSATPAILHWSYVTAAEMAERLQKTTAAKNYYQLALSINKNDIPTRLALSDILLEEKEYKQVEAITSDYLENDAMYLRFVRALNIQGDLRTSSHFCGLKRRIINYNEQQAHLHYDTLAEYYYYFNQGQELALKYARQHFAGQKTPRDARLLAKVAVSLINEPAIMQISQWQGEHKTEDKVLWKILDEVLI